MSNDVYLGNPLLKKRQYGLNLPKNKLKSISSVKMTWYTCKELCEDRDLGSWSSTF